MPRVAIKTWILDRFRNRNRFEKFIILNLPILSCILFLDVFTTISNDSWFGNLLALWVYATGPITAIFLILYLVLTPVFFVLALPFVLTFGKKKDS